LIAISALLVLLATAVFAQPSLGGHFGAQAVIIQGSSGEDANGDALPLTGGAAIKGARVNAQFANGDGTAGGVVRLLSAQYNGYWGSQAFAFAWWKPIPQLRIQLGNNPDGDFGAQQIGGWGFNAEAQDFVAIDKDNGEAGSVVSGYARSPGFYPGYGELGAAISIYPIEGLTINLAIPFASGRDNKTDVQVGDIYSKIHLNILYKLTDIGDLRITFVGQGGLADNDDYERKLSVGDIYASFFLTAIDDLGVDIGVKFGLPYENDAGVDVSPGLQVGLGVRYTSGDFGVKFRAGATLAGSTGDDKNNTNIGFGILPYYTLPAFRVYLNAGMGMSIPDADAASDYTKVGWFVNPYITKSISSLTFYAGFKLASDGAADKDSDAVINWGIPIGFNCYF